MNSLWLTIPPWLFAVVISLIGQWGERKFAQGHSRKQTTEDASWTDIGVLLFSCYIFWSILPAAMLLLFGPLLPFVGARAGMAIAVAVLMFGLIPARLIDAPKTGWDQAFWSLLIDVVRIGGSFTLIGWLLNR